LTVQELVALGHGVSLIPRMAVDGDQSQQRKYRSLTGEKPKRTIAMIWRKHRYQSPAVQRLIEALRQHTANGWSTNGRRKRARAGERRA